MGRQHCVRHRENGVTVQAYTRACILRDGRIGDGERPVVMVDGLGRRIRGYRHVRQGELHLRLDRAAAYDRAVAVERGCRDG